MVSEGEELSRLALENFQKGDYAAALEQARAVVQDAEQNAMMWQICGLASLQLGQFQSGLAALEKTLSLCGDDAHLLNNIGIAKRRLGDLDGAVQAYSKSIKLCPDLAATHNNLADTLVALNRWEDSVTSFRTALMIAPQDVSTRFNYANLLRDMGDCALACGEYDKLIGQFPDDPEIKWNAALAYLAVGDWAKGFEYYESRFGLKHMSQPPIPAGIPRWDGEPLQDKKILIVSEQGFGDLFQMLACASRMHQRGARVVVQCHPRLHRLILASPVVDEVCDESGQYDQVDYYEWLMSCPGKLHLRAGDVPAAEAWLKVPDDGDDSWKESLADNGRFKVGLNFQGSPEFPHDQFRSLDVRYFQPLFERPDVDMISIQKGFGEDQLDKLPKDSLVAVGHLLDRGHDSFADTARCLHGLDLLITSDTAVAHLAGALGLKVWVVLSTVVDWRWSLSGETSSWYPTMRLFRQRTRGDWEPVISDLMHALDRELNT